MSACAGTRSVALGITYGLVMLLSACGDPDAELGRMFIYHPAESVDASNAYRSIPENQSVAMLTPFGPFLPAATPYRGKRVAFEQGAWDPQERILYTYAVNERPSKTWLIGIALPDLERRAVSEIPPRNRRDPLAPLLAFDTHRRAVVATGRARPCGGGALKVWYSFDVDAGVWTKGTTGDHILTTLVYDPVARNFVGIGIDLDAAGSTRAVMRFDVHGSLISRTPSDLCASLSPRQHGFDFQRFTAALVGSTLQVYRLVHYGRKAVDGLLWEYQRYDVDVETGAIARVDWPCGGLPNCGR